MYIYEYASARKSYPIRVDPMGNVQRHSRYALSVRPRVGLGFQRLSKRSVAIFSCQQPHKKRAAASAWFTTHATYGILCETPSLRDNPHQQRLAMCFSPPTVTCVVIVGSFFLDAPESARLLRLSLKHPKNEKSVSYWYTLMAFLPPHVCLVSPAQEKSHVVLPSLLGVSDEGPQKHCSAMFYVGHGGSRDEQKMPGKIVVGRVAWGNRWGGRRQRMCAK